MLKKLPVSWKERTCRGAIHVLAWIHGGGLNREAGSNSIVSSDMQRSRCAAALVKFINDEPSTQQFSNVFKNFFDVQKFCRGTPHLCNQRSIPPFCLRQFRQRRATVHISILRLLPQVDLLSIMFQPSDPIPSFTSEKNVYDDISRSHDRETA